MVAPPLRGGGLIQQLGENERFRLEYDVIQNLARVVDLGTVEKPTNIALTGWMVQEAALVVRDAYYTGHLTP
jgi:hypothetical protein